jgi:hypothetical protein
MLNMSTSTKFKEEISKSNMPNINGYVLDNSDNLIDGVEIEIFQNDLFSGAGSELKSKFNAVYSSSALCVNNFSIVKKHFKDFQFFDNTNFTKAQFERPFKTGLGGTPPNLDFAVENANVVIAFESKYLELLDKKEVKFTDSYNTDKLDLNDFWFEQIEYYRGKIMYLDVAQLIKHSIGLLKYKKDTGINVILVYIYWTPDNKDEYCEYAQHKEELNEFSKRLNQINEIEFQSMTYDEFWKNDKNNDNFKSHFEKVKGRYKTEIH